MVPFLNEGVWNSSYMSNKIWPYMCQTFIHLINELSLLINQYLDPLKFFCDKFTSGFVLISKYQINLSILICKQQQVDFYIQFTKASSGLLSPTPTIQIPSAFHLASTISGLLFFSFLAATTSSWKRTVLNCDKQSKSIFSRGCITKNLKLI